jgi:formimidoylglutamate deiminase
MRVEVPMLQSVPLRFLHARRGYLAGSFVEGVRVGVANGKIQTVESGCDAQPGDERHNVLMPAVGNVHSHAFQRAMAGLAEVREPGSDSFWSWRNTMYRFAQLMSPDQMEAVAAMAYAEMLEAGFCRVGEFHYLHHDIDGRPYANRAEMAERIVAASERTGIALTLLPVFYAHSGFGGGAPTVGQRRFVSGIDDFAQLLQLSERAASRLPNAVVGVAPHSLRAVTPEELTELRSMARGKLVHMHVSEQIREVEECVAWSGARPVEWLLDHAPVDDRWCLIHATHLSDGEIAAIAQGGATVGLCPITEANLGDGIFAAAPFIENGGRIAVGSDSNVLISLADELRTLEYSQRVSLRARNVLAAGEGSTGAALFDRAMTGGAHALGFSSAIKVGAPADLLALDTSKVPWLSTRHVVDCWIFSASARVDAVWVGGERLVQHGRHIRRDDIETRFHQVMADLLNS